MSYKKKNLQITSEEYFNYIMEQEEERLAEKDLKERRRPKKRKPVKIRKVKEI